MRKQPYRCESSPTGAKAALQVRKQGRAPRGIPAGGEGPPSPWWGADTILGILVDITTIIIIIE